MLALAAEEAEQRRAMMENQRLEQENAEKVKLAAEDEAKRRADEARMAEERRVAEAKTRAAEEQRVAQEKAEAEAKAKVLAEAESKKREDEARAATEKRLAQEKSEAETKAKAVAEAQEKLRVAELQRVAERERAEEEQRAAESKILKARRDEESRQLAARLAAAEAARQAAAAAAQAEVAKSEVVRSQQTTSASMPLAAIPNSPSARVTRATVLIVMEPGKTGIRRFEKAADPVLCTRTGCYISAGPGAPARFVSMAKALGPAGTLGERAGVCRHSLVCVFRDVDLSASAGYLQPVDMKVMLHDRRESQIVTADSECRLDPDRIGCRRPIVTAGYRMWVLNEGLAVLAGPDALAAAVRDGLPPPKGQSAGLD